MREISENPGDVWTEKGNTSRWFQGSGPVASIFKLSSEKFECLGHGM